jgi:conjugal transfer pilus assembly protein TraB
MIQFYRSLKPGAKAWIIRAGVIVLILVVGYPIYRASSHKPQRPKKEGEYKVLQGDAETFEKALYHKTKQEMEELRNQIKELKEAAAKPSIVNPAKPNQKKMDRLKTSIEERLRKEKGKAPPVDQQIFANVTTPNLAKTPAPKIEKPTLGIKTIMGVAPEKGSDNDTIHLPPSFMDASLLTGVVAPATRVGEENPTPMLIRIKEMAILPNEVKEDLKGCFVVAEGSGNLAQERVKARLLNLSCITKKGDAIIDQPIKGWVVDADGRAGLSGHVVAKFGSHVARVAIAGFLEGFGKALELSVTETTTNAFGTQSSQLENTTGETLAKAGAGRSIVNVAKDLQKFYLQLASQTMPVIEVGPTKNITVVISEGEELVIKERKKYAQKD